MHRRYGLSLLMVLALGANPAQTQDVQRVEVREGGLVGRFYAAAGASRRTGLLMLTGSGGGYPDEYVARDLAGAGYPVFALAYFRTRAGDPPELEQKELRNVPLEYIFKGLDWLKARPEVRADRIVLMDRGRVLADDTLAGFRERAGHDGGHGASLETVFLSLTGRTLRD